MSIRHPLNPNTEELEIILQGLRILQDEMYGTQNLSWREEQTLEYLISECEELLNDI